MPILGPPPSWHYADIFLGPPLADSQRPSKKCWTARILAPSKNVFGTLLDKIVENPNKKYLLLQKSF